MSIASNIRRTNRKKSKRHQPVKYKVSRGVWRTAAQTREILGLPSSFQLPPHICKLPHAALLRMIDAAKARMDTKQAKESAPEMEPAVCETPAATAQ